MAASSTTLNGAITGQQTQVRLLSYTRPTQQFRTPVLLLIEAELMLVTNDAVSPVLTVVRGYDGTQAIAHLTGVNVVYGLASEITDPTVDDGVVSHLHQLSVTLTDTQIKALPSTQVQILPAPGSRRGYLPFASSLILTTTDGSPTVDYSNIDTTYADMSVNWTMGDAKALTYLVNDASKTTLSDFLTAGGTGQVIGAVANLSPYLFSFTPKVYPPAFAMTLIDNAVMSIASFNGYPASVGNFTGGATKNILRVNLSYFIVNIGTGEYL